MENSLINQPRMYPRFLLLGAGINLIINVLFITDLDTTNSAWSPFWMVKPLTLGPLITGLGAMLAFYVVKFLINQNISKYISYFSFVAIFIISIWLGIVLGFNGTLWD